MKTEQLREFLTASKEGGYAGGEEKQWLKEPDGSTTIVFEQEGWRSHDNFFGGEPYGGRTVVFHEAKPQWLMVYYGWVDDGFDANRAYSVLRRALMQMPADHPFRGPAEYQDGELLYTNSWTGDIARFAGEESIRHGEHLVYQAQYAGGVVDRRSAV